MEKESSELHDKLVNAMAKQYAGDGCLRVRADHIDHPNGAPDAIGGIVPDVSASCNGVSIICEAEADKESFNAETYKQLKVFDGASAQLHVIVPKPIVEFAKAKCQEWGISVDRWWLE